jgi:uncharacterized SAM-binding protein YcdF (DUF218 family)
MARFVKPKPNGGKKTFGKRNLFLLNFVLFIIPASYLGYRPFLRYSASAIIADSQPTKADAIVLLAGGEPGRAWGAADLYLQKLAPYIVLTREPPGPDAIELRKRGIELTTGFDMNTRILRGLGVPQDAITRLDPFVNDTFDEITRVRELAQQRGWKSLVIVTSNYHTRRSRLVARYVLNSDINFTVVGSGHGGLNRDSWWQSRDGVRTFLIEFEKLVAYTLYIGPRMIL